MEQAQGLVVNTSLTFNKPPVERGIVGNDKRRAAGERTHLHRIDGLPGELCNHLRSAGVARNRSSVAAPDEPAHRGDHHENHLFQ